MELRGWSLPPWPKLFTERDFLIETHQVAILILSYLTDNMFLIANWIEVGTTKGVAGNRKPPGVFPSKASCLPPQENHRITR